MIMSGGTTPARTGAGLAASVGPATAAAASRSRSSMAARASPAEGEALLEQLERLSALRGAGGLSAHEFVAAKQRLLGATGDSAVAAHNLAGGAVSLVGEEHAIDQDAHYLMDLNGFIVVKGVLSGEELERGNSAIDAYHDRIREGGVGSTAQDSEGMAGTKGRGGMGSLISLPEPHRQAFTDLLAHPKIVPVRTAQHLSHLSRRCSFLSYCTCSTAPATGDLTGGSTG
jgi:hypothetical protein